MEELCEKESKLCEIAKHAGWIAGLIISLIMIVAGYMQNH